MIFAEVQGKLGRYSSHAHERAEDLLTSTVFGMLSYLPFRQGIGAFLQKARTVRFGDGHVSVRFDPGWLDLTGVEKINVVFWPQWGSYGVPDLLLELQADDGTPIHRIVIEAKLHSPKSGCGEKVDDGDSGPDESEERQADGSEWQPASVSGDQLMKYWQGLGARYSDTNVPRTLLYLTAHSIPPLSELGDSLQYEPSMRLGWVSWSDVWYALRTTQFEREQGVIAEDLCRLLAYKKLRGFDGFPESVIAVPKRSFWRSRPWFGDTPPVIEHTSTGFWRDL